ncbi:MAG: hypothetical protein Q7S22_02160 [Candidatus Micrarchaeota archaeon]|nr:hypothetical protein [Candidatus Micrarchaeota archaeon]
MAVYHEKCRAIFRDRILPHFPHAKDRFVRYFSESYDLVRALPLMNHPSSYIIPFRFRHPIKYRDTQETPLDERLASYLSRVFDIEVAFTILGLKPLTIVESDQVDIFLNRYGIRMFQDTGIEFFVIPNILFGKPLEKEFELWIYDPLIIMPILSSLLNRKVPRDKVREALAEFDCLDMPHELLGYPDPFSLVDKFGHHNTLGVSSWGKLLHADSLPVLFSIEYCTEVMGCVIESRDLFLPTIRKWALAAAMVEEIRETSTAIISRSDITNRTNPKSTSIVMASVIERSKVVGEWKVSEYGTSNP